MQSAEKGGVVAPAGKGNGNGIRAPLQRKIRRQVAGILRIVLVGDTQRQSQASIRSLIYSPSIVAKKATLALTCRCLKYLSILKEVVAATDLLSNKKKVSAELVYVLACELLFGQEELSSGDAETFVLSRKSSLKTALVRLLVKKNATSVEDLVASHLQVPEISIPRYVRVNTLKITVAEALKDLQKLTESVEEDNLIPELLLLPSGTDLHKHHLVLNGSLLLQGKASCMPALVLAPKTGWEVLDACAAPGNKTVHLAALMKGTGRIHACEVDSKRVLRLQETVKLAGASNVEVHHQDFLRLNPLKLPFSKVQGILLDPSCSGSGTSVQRLDYLLPSSAMVNKDYAEVQRIEQLAQFQERALLHALSFPAVERVVYSTCSINQRENEDVVKDTLPHARALGFQLASAFPEWQHRGLPVFDGAHHLVRTDAARDQMDGFFVALFVRAHRASHVGNEGSSRSVPTPPSNPTGQPFLPTVQNSEAARLSKLRRRKMKRQRRKAQEAAAGKDALL